MDFQKHIALLDGELVTSSPMRNSLARLRKYTTLLLLVRLIHFSIACAEALSFPESYYEELRNDYDKKRKMLLDSLGLIGFDCVDPSGAYYIWSDFSELDDKLNDVEFCRKLVEKVGVAVVPGSSFFYRSDHGSKKVRFTFSKKMETLEKACERLEKNL